MRKIAIASGIALVLAALTFAFWPFRPRAAPEPKKETLVIYSPHPAEITEYIVREFRQRTGIEVQVISAGTGELIERMKANEKKGEADLFWGGGVESLETVTDLFNEFTSTEENAIQAVYKAPHGKWHPFSVLPAVIIYNETLVPKEHIPDSWASLLDPYFKNRLIMADPEKSGSSFTILATMLWTMSKNGSGAFSGWDYVERIIGQLGEGGLASSSNMVYRSVASGDFYAGITFENYVLSLQKTGANVAYCYPAEGTSAVPDGIALLKTSQHTVEAGQFINFVLGRDVQDILLARWQRRTVRTDIGEKKTGFTSGPDSARAGFIRYPVSEAASERGPILAHWEALYARPEIPSASVR